MTVWHEWRRPRSGGHVGSNHLRDHREHGLEAASLLTYVVAARIDLLAEREFDSLGRWQPAPPVDVWNRESIARRLGYSAEHISHLTRNAGTQTSDQILQLEQRLMTVAYGHRGFSRDGFRALGSLSSYAEDLLTRTQHRRRTPHLARWHSDLAALGPRNSADALVLGETLLGLISGCVNETEGDEIWSQHSDTAERTVRALVAVATRPPGGGALAAASLAAEFGVRVVPVVQEHLRHSPLGHRALRVVWRMLEHFPNSPMPWWSTNADQEWTALKGLLRDTSEELNDLPDPYPGRTLFAEAVRESIRVGSSRGDSQWNETAANILRGIAGDPSRPRRERVYAAICLADPRVDPHGTAEGICERYDDGDEVWRYVRRLLAIGPNKTVSSLLFHGDVLREYKIEEADLVSSICMTAGADPDDPALLTYLDRLPQPTRSMTRKLLRIALISPDGIPRRRATEALREAGVTNEAAQIVVEIMFSASQDWLQEMCAFVLGQLGDPSVCAALETVAADGSRSSAVRHAALFALGDLRRYRPETIALARKILMAPSGTVDAPIRHSAAYALAVLRPLGPDAGDDRERGLLQLLAHPDNAGVDHTTRLLAQWGLATDRRVNARDAYASDSEIWGLYPAAGS